MEDRSKPMVMFSDTRSRTDKMADIKRIKNMKTTDKIKLILLRSLHISLEEGENVVPRYIKSQTEQKTRTKQKAEVFTPISIVRKMNDNFDNSFTGSDIEYINRACLEVTCGEAPFLTTRYDATTGQEIPIAERIGLLDRKLQHISSTDPAEWSELALSALKATYGYEWQEDSIYIARQNLLLTTMEHFFYTFNQEADEETISKWADVISYNIFRMDGVTMCIPETDIPAMVMNWTTNKMERFDGIIEEHRLW